MNMKQALLVIFLGSLIASGVYIGIFLGLVPALSQAPPSQTNQFNMMPGVNSYTYSSGITSTFQLQNPITASMVTSNVLPAIYSPTAKPFSLTSTDVAASAAAYSSPAWSVVANAGSYQMLVKDSAVSPVFYPSLTSVTVSGVNSTGLTGIPTAPLNPPVIQLQTRGTLGLATAVYGYDADTGLYSHSLSTTWNATLYTKAEVQVTASVGGLGTVIEGGRLYLPVYPGLTYTGATIGSSTATIGYSLDATQDGLTGYYVNFPDISGGQTVVINLFVSKTSSYTAGSFGMTFHEAEAIANPLLRWWTDSTQTVTLTAVA